MVQETTHSEGYTEPPTSDEPEVIRDQTESFQLSLFSEPDPIARPEYNVGKYAGVIFISPYSKKVRDRRTHVLKIDQDTGKTLSLNITPLKDQKTPTTTTLRVFLALFDLWYQQGQNPSGEIIFSARQLVHVMGRKWQGASSAELVEEHINILYGAKIDWLASFATKDDPRNTKLNMVFLERAEYMPREYAVTGALGRSHRVILARELVRNMLEGHVRPLNHETLRSITNDTVATLYTLLDLHLSSTSKIETGSIRKRNATKLIYNDLGLDGERYRQKKHRKKLLNDFVSALSGRELVHGKLECWIEDSADKKDFNLVYRKIPRRTLPPRTRVATICSQEEANQVAFEICEQIEALGGTGTKRPYIAFLARYVPKSVLFESLSIAKAEYREKGKTLGAVFNGIVKNKVEKHKIPLPVRK